MWIEKLGQWFRPKAEPEPQPVVAEPVKPTKRAKKKSAAEEPVAPPKKSRKKKQPELTEKERATADGRAYIQIVDLSLDPDNVGVGSFELDWNQQFVHQLMQQGYRGQSDEQIVDQWFQTVCRNIAMEEWEQYVADPTNRVNRKNLGDGRIEVS
jgi:hypothetical protein